MTLDPGTVGGLVTLAGVLGAGLTKLGDWIFAYIQKRMEKKRLEMEARNNQNKNEDERRDITVKELWDLIKHLKAEQEQDRVTYQTREEEYQRRFAAYEKELNRCHEEHRNSELDRGRSLARIEILEDQVTRLGGRVKPQKPRGLNNQSSATHTPLPAPEPEPEDEGDSP